MSLHLFIWQADFVNIFFSAFLLAHILAKIKSRDFASFSASFVWQTFQHKTRSQYQCYDTHILDQATVQQRTTRSNQCVKME